MTYIASKWPEQGTAAYDRVMQDSSPHGEGELKNATTISVPSNHTASDMPVEGEQPVLFYDGSPMHDYLASVAPDEAPTMDVRRRLSSGSSVTSHQGGGGVAADGPASSTAEGEVTSAPAARRKVRPHTFKQTDHTDASIHASSCRSYYLDLTSFSISENLDLLAGQT